MGVFDLGCPQAQTFSNEYMSNYYYYDVKLLINKVARACMYIHVFNALEQCFGCDLEGLREQNDSLSSNYMQEQQNQSL